MSLSEEETALADGTKGKIMSCDFFVNLHQKVPRLPTLPAAILQIFLCLGQIGRNWVAHMFPGKHFSLGVPAARPL